MWRVLLLLLAPLLLVGPALLPGQRFLPQAPVGFEPLASEHPQAAERAWVGANYLTSDRLFPVLTDELAMRARLARGEWPAWEPNFGLGAPLFAGSIASLAYPPNWLRYVLPPDLAGGWSALLSLFLAGLGLWLFLERRGLAFSACAVGAVAYQTGGFALLNLHYLMKVDAALWLPWACWAVDGLYRSSRHADRPAWAGLALTGAIACALLAGFPQIGMFTAYATAAYALWRAFELRSTPAGPSSVAAGGRALVMIVLGLGVASVYLVPMAEVSAHAIRQPQSIAALTAQAMPLAALKSLLFAADLERPGPDFFHASELEWSLHAGVGVLLLALAGLVRARRGALFPVLLGVLALGYAQAWPGVRWLYALPGLDLGAPSRAVSVLWFVLPWLAALGVQRLRPRASIIIVTLILLEAWVAWHAGLRPRALEDEPLFPPSAALEAVREATGDGHVLRFDASESGLDDVLVLARPNLLHAYGIADLTPYVVFTNRRLVELFESMDPRTRYRTGISRVPSVDLLGHPVLDLARVTCILARRPLEHPRLTLVFEAPEFFVYRRSGSLPLARGVTRAITVPTDDTALGLIASGTANLREAVVLAPGHTPRLPAPSCEEPVVRVLKVARPTPERLDLVVESSCGGWVVMSEAWMPGWQATVNGKDTSIARADHVARAVRVPAGRSLVRTKYEPGSRRLGLALTLCALLAALFLTRRRAPT